MKEFPVKSRSIQIFSVMLVTTTSILLAACSTSGSRPDAGQQISARGGAISARGQDWTDGQSDLNKGRKLVAQSEKRTADGEKKLRRAQDATAKAQRQIQQADADRVQGQQLMSGGTTRMQRAEAGYAAIRSGPAATAPQ